MDQKVSAVLDVYHTRMIREEKEFLHHQPPTPASLNARLLAVGPETGQLLNIVVRSLSAPTILELGTSYGYSGIWLAEAAQATGGRLITMELESYKSSYAQDLARKAGLAAFIDFQVGDAVQMIANLSVRVDFVLVDLWKNLYVPCLDAFYPRLNPGAIIVADNMLRPGGAEIDRYREAVRSKQGITSVLLRVGSGVEVSRFEPT